MFYVISVIILGLSTAAGPVEEHAITGPFNTVEQCALFTKMMQDNATNYGTAYTKLECVRRELKGKES